MKHPPRHKQIPLYLIALIIVVLAFIIFGNGIGGGFVYDDHWVIELNSHLNESGMFLKQFVLPYHYQQPDTGLYRPLTLMSFVVNLWFSKGAAGFHIINILIHALNVILLYLLLEKLFNRRAISIVASVLFLVLPIHVEAVTSIIGRADLLATFFALLSVYACVRQKYVWSAIALLLALFSKESAIGIIFVLAYVLFVLQKKTFREVVRICVWYVSAGLIYATLRYAALGQFFLANDASTVYNPLKYSGFISRLVTAIKIFGMYLWKSIFPIHLSADYSYNQISLASRADMFSIAAVFAMLGALVGIIFWRRTRNSIYAFGAILLVGTFLVVSNFIVPIGTIMAERTFYLPSIGLAVILGAAAAHILESRWRKLALIPLIIIGIIYGARAAARNIVWHDEGTLFADMVTTAPQSVHANNNLAIYYMKNDQWNKARPLLEKAVSITPDHVSLQDSLGIMAEHDERYAEAEQYYLRALELRPHYLTAVSNLTHMYYTNGQFEKAADVALREYQSKKNDDVYTVYAMSMIRLKRYSDVIQAIRAEYGDNPQNGKVVFALGVAYWKSGDKTNGQKYLSRVRDPNLSEAEFYDTINKL